MAPVGPGLSARAGGAGWREALAAAREITLGDLHHGVQERLDVALQLLALALLVVALGLGPVKIWVLMILGGGVFALTFYAMRELFKRRSGGLGFR